jgi:hypothetical protein
MHAASSMVQCAGPSVQPRNPPLPRRRRNIAKTEEVSPADRRPLSNSTRLVRRLFDWLETCSPQRIVATG